MNQDSNIVVVGGGIGGMFAARCLLSFGFTNITIVERADDLGGLLRSAVYSNPDTPDNDLVFDYGTHFVLKTGDPELDKILQLDLPLENFTEFAGSLPEGQFTNGQYYAASGCLNTLLFSDEIAARIKEEISGLIDNPLINNRNLEELLKTKYGQYAFDRIWKPVFDKFAGFAPGQLDCTVETAFNPSRIIVADRSKSRQLKSECFWDERIAFAHHEDGTSNVLKYYPKQGGIQKWIDEIELSLRKAGVKIKTGDSISAIQCNGDEIRTVGLESGDTLDCDYLLWTIPPIFLAHILDTKVPSKKPTMRSVSVVNIVSDQKPVEGPFWVTVFDSAMKSYRVTLYDNFSTRHISDGHRVTVEILHSGDFEGSQQNQRAIFDELLEMKLLPLTTKLIWSAHENIPNGFPVMQAGDLEIYDDQVEILSNTISNLHMVSRFRGGSSGQIPILKNLHQSISELAKNTPMP